MKDINLNPLTPEELALENDSTNDNEDTDGVHVLPIPKEQLDKAMATIRDKKGNKPNLIIPYGEANGDVLFLEVRFDFTNNEGLPDKIVLPYCWWKYPDGREEWKSKQPLIKDRPLLNLPKITTEVNKSIIVVEGEKTAIASAKLFPNHTSTTSCSGSNATKQTDWSSMKGRNIIIAMDNDPAGFQYGKNVYALCTAAGAASIRFFNNDIFTIYEIKEGNIVKLGVPRELPQKYDLANALEEGWTAEIFEGFEGTTGISLFVKYKEIFSDVIIKDDGTLVEEALKEKAKHALPPGFSIRKNGLYFDDEWICSPIEVLACTRDENQENWGRLVRFKDLDNHMHQIALPMELWKGDCSDLFGMLLSLGLRIVVKKPNRNKLAEYLQSINIEKKALCTSRIGWHGNYFVLPNGSIPETDEIYLQSDNNNFVGFRTQGTQEEWQNYIARPCQGNSRLVFALSCAFAAPLCPLIHIESGGFNLKGASSIGKSTALAVAASVWGSPKYVQTWRATGNALEAVAEAHNNALLCLDELGQVDGKEAGEIAYMLTNGSGKNRMKAKGGLRKRSAWNLLFLSTGEISIINKIHEAGKSTQAGMVTRMVDIPADANKGYRLFDTIHDFKDGNALAHHLQSSVSKFYGTPIYSYLKDLATIKEGLPGVVEQIKQDFFLEFVPDAADGQVQRVAQRFVVAATGGELAIKLGILPYNVGEAYAAAGMCFKACLEERGGTKGYEGEEAIKQVQAFFEAHYSSRFATITINDSNEYNNTDEQKVINQAGYKRKCKQQNNEESYEFFVFPEVFRNEICKGFDVRMVCQELEKRGFLIRGNKRQFVKEQRLPVIGRKKIYHLTSAILTGADE